MLDTQLPALLNDRQMGNYIGEDQLVRASDYPHGDPSHEGDMVGEVEKRTDLPKRLRDKILSDNPRRLYGL